MCYSEGEGVPQNYAEAVKWYRKSADQGHASAQYNLGECYYKGEGVSENYIEAYKWTILAAVHGNSDAKHNRDLLQKHMSPLQIAEAQRLAAEFRPVTQK